MAQVTIKINGYAYTLGCEDGQEAHLQSMAEEVESRIENIKALGTQSGEARLLVLASLLMADELHDLRAEIADAAVNGTKPAKPDREMARSLAKMANRAEEIATNLERP
jgi:cell division protein ZapA